MLWVELNINKSKDNEGCSHNFTSGWHYVLLHWCLHCLKNLINSAITISDNWSQNDWLYDVMVLDRLNYIMQWKMFNKTFRWVAIQFTVRVCFTRVHTCIAYRVHISLPVSSSLSSGMVMDMLLRILTCGWLCSFLSRVSFWFMGKQGISYLLPAVDMVDILLLLPVKEFVEHIQLIVLVSLGMGELAVDMEKDVLVLVSAWLSVDLGCWSLVAAMWAKDWLTVCGMVVVGVDGPEMGLWCVIVEESGLEMRLLLDIVGHGMWLWGCRMADCCVFAWSAEMLWSLDVTRCCCFTVLILGLLLEFVLRWSWNGGRYVVVQGAYVLFCSLVLSALTCDDVACRCGCKSMLWCLECKHWACQVIKRVPLDLGVSLVVIWHYVICHGFLSGGLFWIWSSCIFLQSQLAVRVVLGIPQFCCEVFLWVRACEVLWGVNQRLRNSVSNDVP